MLTSFHLVLTVLFSPHLLAPTASDLVKYSEKDTILAGFHTDLNFLTIHGRSRYPGLHIWARNTGKRIPVRFPPTGRYLLVQAGKQLEHLSGGLIKAGYHEVVVNESTVEVIPSRNCAVMHLYSLYLRLSKGARRNSQIALLLGYPLRSFGTSHLITILHQFRL
jgi:hypothetical protein